MEPADGDSIMPDAPGNLSQELEPLFGWNQSNQNMVTAGLASPDDPDDMPRPGTSSSETTGITLSTKHLRERSREPSVLANNVANNLSIGSHDDKPGRQLNGGLDGSDEERGPPAPYTSSLPTGLCYDVRMRYHCELDPPKQRLDYHPEDPRRIFKIYKELCVAGLVRDALLNTESLIPNPLMPIFAREVTEAEVCLVHDKRHFDFMKATSTMPPELLIELEKRFDSIYFNTETFYCALLSTGGAIETCRAVAGGQVRNAIAVIRPPGHHAECNRPMGFCIFDNVSIAAKVCQQDFAETCKKILILDWDVHHGNGIQQAFYQDPSVLYISLHVHEGGEFYPQGPYGNHLHCGADSAEGKNINIPWPTKGMGDADYLLAFQRVVMPVAYDFDPDLVIIAAGFDAADGDQLGGCHVTPQCYAQMTHMLMGLAQGRLVVCLEGGYNLTSISMSALAVTRTLIGEKPDRIVEKKATKKGIDTVQMVATHQSRYWPSLFLKDVSSDTFAKTGADRMHDVIRYYQANQMRESQNMSNVVIYRDKLSKTFDGQIMATANFEEAVPLVVIFHDPPDIMGTPEPVSKRLELHNTWLADGLKHYVDWSASQGFAVIDVNVPKHVTGVEANDSPSEDDQEENAPAAHELATYLWDNYIDCNDASHVFFISVGSAYRSIIKLLEIRCEQSFLNRVSGLINFVGGSALLAVANQPVIYWLSKWYKTNSLIFVANNHLVWDMEPSKKRSKRYGNLVKSPVQGLNDMLTTHQTAVQDFILSRINKRTVEVPERIDI